MGDLSDIRHIQLARILGLPRTAPVSAVEDALRENPAALAAAFFAEAADSDDVTGAASAMVYLEDRLAFFGQVIAPATAATVREGFTRHLAAWAE